MSFGLAYEHVYGALSILLVDVGGASPGKVGLNYIRKMSLEVSRIPPWFQLLTKIFALASLENWL